MDAPRAPAVLLPTPILLRVQRGNIGAADVGRHQGALAKYNALNEAHPTTTKVGTSVVILLFGDTMAQRIQHRSAAKTSEDGAAPAFRMDWRRLAAFASFGAIYTGYFQMHWFRYLQTVFPRQVGLKARFLRKDVLAPLLVNQLGMVCVGYYPFFFAWTGFVRGRTWDESMEEMKKKYKLKLLAQNWGVLDSRAGRAVRAGAELVSHTLRVGDGFGVEHDLVAGDAGEDTRGCAGAQAQKSVTRVSSRLMTVTPS